MYIYYVYTYRGLAKKNPTVFNLFLPNELQFHAD